MARREIEMHADALRQLMNSVVEGSVSVEEAVTRLQAAQVEDLGFANVDHHRADRTGRPEVVFCQGKTTPQIVEITSRLAERHPVVLATRAGEDVFRVVQEHVPTAQYHAEARIIEVRGNGAPPPPPDDAPYVLVCCAGTADIPVAEEAAVTARAMGSRVVTLYDVGVAGIHRLLRRADVLYEAGAIVVAAGMDGALPTVVAGLVSVPVVAVPTSIGYGASFGGVAALLTMLNACATGVAVVNIDNGFGAGVYAHLVNSKTPRRETKS